MLPGWLRRCHAVIRAKHAFNSEQTKQDSTTSSNFEEVETQVLGSPQSLYSPICICLEFPHRIYLEVYHTPISSFKVGQEVPNFIIPDHIDVEQTGRHLHANSRAQLANGCNLITFMEPSG